MRKKDTWNISRKTFIQPILFALVFYAIAVWRFYATGKVFYLYNFGYIGTALALGVFSANALPKKHSTWGRRIAQVFIGSYMLFFVGMYYHENMQFEGFVFYLLMGIFAGSTLHYFIAKIAGPFVIGRGWCGWACWTAMILDLLPWKRPARGRLRRFGAIRYAHLIVSTGLVLYTWFALKIQPETMKTSMELYWFAVGNTAYYGIGFILAAVLQDNRAFCKYICPIPVLQKVGAPFSVMKIKIDPVKCTECGVCEKNCPMGIQLLDYKRRGKRILSTECIVCSTCADTCPRSAVTWSPGFDLGWKEYLTFSPTRSELPQSDRISSGKRK